MVFRRRRLVEAIGARPRAGFGLTVRVELSPPASRHDAFPLASLLFLHNLWIFLSRRGATERHTGRRGRGGIETGASSGRAQPPRQRSTYTTSFAAQDHNGIQIEKGILTSSMT